jgi:two-component system, cell cycle response regulator DivK
VTVDELVLIVDDNDRNVKLVRDVLRFSGFRTLEASTCGAAVSLAAEHVPDVILMDIRLPDMDGTDALLRLREGEATASIPVVALTSFAMKGDRERLLATGFDGYLEKPISVREFPDQVRSHCRRDEASARVHL